MSTDSKKAPDQKRSKGTHSLATWSSVLYDPGLFGPTELKEIYDSFRYIGFDRQEVLTDLERVLPDPRDAAKMVILCALRGPRAASKTPFKNGQTPAGMGIAASDKKGQKGISCSRVVSSTADLAAFYLKQVDVPKRIPSHPLPGWLQFPAAGSIKLPSDLRELHIDFSQKFSTLIGGKFNESIYSQMQANAYLDSGLKLFEPP
jgi:hypothetical protein